MSATPISGNQNYTKVNNTVVTASAVFNALQVMQGALNLKTYFLQAVPTDTGFYDLLDENDNTFELHPGDVVQATTILGNDTLTSGGAPTFQVALSPEPVSGTPSVGDALTPAETLASTNAGKTDVTNTAVAANTHPVLEITAAVTSGRVNVRLLVVPIQM